MRCLAALAGNLSRLKDAVTIMWDYSETLKDHFFNPRNAGTLKQSNAVGDVGSVACGDALRLSLQVDTSNDVIQDAGFETFGCGSAIASSSALTEMIKGKTLDEALKINNQDIAAYLDGLPPEKMHCSVMGWEALRAAVANYRGETWEDDHEEGKLVCKCYAVDDVLIERVARANKLSTVQDIMNYTKAGGGCSACHEGIEEILAKVAIENDQAVTASTVPAAPTAPTGQLLPVWTAPKKTPAKKTSPMTNVQRMHRIEAVLESLRPQLQADYGDVELIEVDGKTVYLSMTGACAGCQMAPVTLGGIQQRLLEELGEFIRIVPVAPKSARMEI